MDCAFMKRIHDLDGTGTHYQSTFFSGPTIDTVVTAHATKRPVPVWANITFTGSGSLTFNMGDATPIYTIRAAYMDTRMDHVYFYWGPLLFDTYSSNTAILGQTLNAVGLGLYITVGYYLI